MWISCLFLKGLFLEAMAGLFLEASIDLDLMWLQHYCSKSSQIITTCIATIDFKDSTIHKAGPLHYFSAMKLTIIILTKTKRCEPKIY